MTTLSAIRPTLLDLARASDPDGKIAPVVEILNEVNEMLDDLVFTEGNLPTGHKTTVRTGIPDPTWRKIYGGVQPTKSTYAQITASCGMLEAYAEVDKALADLNGNTGAFRTSEDRAHIEGMSQEVQRAFFYESEATNPERITGLAPHYNSTTAANGDNVLKAGGAGSDNASVWLIVWGENTILGITPKGSKTGLQVKDLGEVTAENIDGSNGRAQIYRTHYRWDVGLAVRDWRYAVRICNIDKSLLTKDVTTGADLTALMDDAIERIPSLSAGRAAFYMNRTVKSYLTKQMKNAVKSSTLTMEQLQGKPVMMYSGIPIRRVDQLAADEALVS